MQKVDSPLDKWRGVALGLSFLLVITADQLTKAWVRSYEEGEVIYRQHIIEDCPGVIPRIDHEYGKAGRDYQSN